MTDLYHGLVDCRLQADNISIFIFANTRSEAKVEAFAFFSATLSADYIDIRVRKLLSNLNEELSVEDTECSKLAKYGIGIDEDGYWDLSKYPVGDIGIGKVQ